MTSIVLGDISAFPFVEAPDKRNIQDGVKLLEELGAIKPHRQADKGYQLTDTGRQLAQLPVDPRLARMVIEARKHGAIRETMVIVSALSIQDPRESIWISNKLLMKNIVASMTNNQTFWLF